MKKIEKIEDLSPDDLNANKGTERGYEAIERSLQKYGAGRSILVDKNGRTIAGNKTLEKAAAAGLEIVPVHTKGDKLVVVIRDDLDIESKQARELAIADNRSAELGLDWDMGNIKALMDDGIDVSDFWTDGELRFLNGEELSWNPEKTFDPDIGDGISELTGYGLQSFWKDLKNENCPAYQYQIELPVQPKVNIIRQKYSRTNIDEIQRIIKTYMREGDFFLENCCGWSIFASIAKFFGYNGIGIDIWDVALNHSVKQMQHMPGNGDVKIIKMNGMETKFSDNKFDFIYCNPPFTDQEKYSGKSNDIADKDFDEFACKFKKLMAENYRILKPGKLCTITINDKREKGVLIPMQAHVINWGKDVGFRLHDFVVAEVQSQKIRLRKKDYKLRRTVKCQEFVITLVK